jgi:putative ABC transport system permease protein
MLGAVDLGLIFAIMSMGVYLTFRVLDFADLTVDGSFVTGGAVAAIGIVNGVDPLLATCGAFFAGAVAGAFTGVLNTAGKINPLLAGILTQIALYSINMRIMGKANLPLLNEPTLFTGLRSNFATWYSVAVFAAIAACFAAALIWFLNTNLGLSMRAVGNNETMAKAEGVQSIGVKILGLSLSNALVAVSGALMAQYQGFADITMGIGMIVVGLASVILGQAIVGQRYVWQAVVAVILGSVLYRLVIQVALGADIGLQPYDMKIISAALVIAALLLPKLPIFQQWARAWRERQIAKDALADDLAAASRIESKIAGGEK